MATPYQRGRGFEYAVQDQLEKRGWATIRAAGSKGPADLWVAKATSAGWARDFDEETLEPVGELRRIFLAELVLVQCKASADSLPPPAEWNTLWELAQRTGGLAVIAWNPAPRKKAYHVLTGPKVTPGLGRTKWPWEEWDPGPKV